MLFMEVSRYEHGTLRDRSIFLNVTPDLETTLLRQRDDRFALSFRHSPPQ